ncbi:MAG: hypothetical protein LBC98_07895, partial [Prevotellaceae bacterium]|nr:hypothetical protein [Prevotellaceae bacterium]
NKRRKQKATSAESRKQQAQKAESNKRRKQKATSRRQKAEIAFCFLHIKPLLLAAFCLLLSADVDVGALRATPLHPHQHLL